MSNKVTLSDIKCGFPQFGQKQFFILTYANVVVLVSYSTTVGILYEGRWLITDEWYSCTTTSQLRAYLRRECIHSPDSESADWLEKMHKVLERG